MKKIRLLLLSLVIIGFAGFYSCQGNPEKQKKEAEEEFEEIKKEGEKRMEEADKVKDSLRKEREDKDTKKD